VNAAAPDRDALVRALRGAGCVFAEQEADLLLAAAAAARADAGRLARLLARRVAGEPLEQVLGWCEFDGLRVTAAPGVFVPRRRTEFLVAQAARLARPGALVVDLCCGSGAIGLAVHHRLGGVVLHAADVDPVAVECARANLAAIGAQVHGGDLFDALPAGLAGQVDLLVANVPYVPTGAIALLPREARLHEPARALDGGVDGLDLVRRVAAGAPRWLAPGGHVLVEVGADQAGPAGEAFTHAGLTTQLAHHADDDTVVVIGARPLTRNGGVGGGRPRRG
jgi:release factor glutamine methyltransferase